MEPVIIESTSLGHPESLIGLVITEEVRTHGERLFRKGHVLGEEQLEKLKRVERPIHAVRLSPDDVHEDVAGTRLASAIAGPGTIRRSPLQSRVNLVAAEKGLLRVDAEAVKRLNRLPGVAVFTLPDRLSVLPGKIVTGAKITPVAIPESVIEEAERIAAERPVVEVKPFIPLSVGVVTTEGMTDATRTRFRAAVTRKVAWFGGNVIGFTELPKDETRVASEIERFVDDGADLVMTAGGNTIDPLDPALRSLDRIGGEMVKFGAPAHPGSMFWLAYRGHVPIFNMASCSMYSRATVADLVLPWIMAGERVELDDMAALGYGGLLDRGMSYRFPPYEAELVVEDDEM
jgi:hypothetical protein